MTRTEISNRLLSVAPMMDWTDRHCRYLHRLLSPHALLYTEMVTTGALIHGDKERFLRFDKSEQPVALQLGGSDPGDLARCAEYGEKAGFDEINLNCGCPSDRVQSGCFGAVLMKDPEHVAKCIKNMSQAVDIPVTVKCRIGVDDIPEEKCLSDFIDRVSQAGCEIFIIHARKAWLHGLSPKENRHIPPLRYKLVEKIKYRYPKLKIILNGGLRTINQIESALKVFDGVMIGRAAYQSPFLLRELENKLFGPRILFGEREIIQAMAEYADAEYQRYGTPVKSVARHMTGLFSGRPGARAWRRELSPLRPEHHGVSDRGNGEILLKIYDSVFNEEDGFLQVENS